MTTYISRKVTMELVKVAGLSHLSKGGSKYNITLGFKFQKLGAQFCCLRGSLLLQPYCSYISC